MNIFLNAQNKLREGWWVLIFFLVLASLLVPLIILSHEQAFEVTLVHQLIIILIASIGCQLLYNKRVNDLFGKINFLWFKELIFGMALGGSLMFIPALLLTLFGLIQWSIYDWSLQTIYTGLMIFGVVALVEEILFRGFIFQRLVGVCGSFVAQAIIAGLFLLTHINNPGMTGTVKVLASINIFIASILFGVAYLKTKKLAMPIGIHFMANFMQGTVLGFGVSGEKDSALLKPKFTSDNMWLTGGEFGLEASLFGLICVIALTSLLYLRNTKN